MEFVEEELASASGRLLEFSRLGDQEGWSDGYKSAAVTSSASTSGCCLNVVLVCRSASRNDVTQLNHVIRCTDKTDQKVLEIDLHDVINYVIKTTQWHEISLKQREDTEESAVRVRCESAVRPSSDDYQPLQTVRPRINNVVPPTGDKHKVIALYFSRTSSDQFARFSAMLEMQLRNIGKYDRLVRAGDISKEREFIEKQRVIEIRLKSLAAEKDENEDMYEYLRRTGRLGSRVGRQQSPLNSRDQNSSSNSGGGGGGGTAVLPLKPWRRAPPPPLPHKPQHMVVDGRPNNAAARQDWRVDCRQRSDVTEPLGVNHRGEQRNDDSWQETTPKQFLSSSPTNPLFPAAPGADGTSVTSRYVRSPEDRWPQPQQMNLIVVQIPRQLLMDDDETAAAAAAVVVNQVNGGRPVPPPRLAVNVEGTSSQDGGLPRRQQTADLQVSDDRSRTVVRPQMTSYHPHGPNDDNNLLHPWTCRCTFFINDRNAYTCKMCDKPRTDAWLCQSPACVRRLNTDDVIVCPVCESIRCRRCSTVNYVTNLDRCPCRLCGSLLTLDDDRWRCTSDACIGGKVMNDVTATSCHVCLSVRCRHCSTINLPHTVMCVRCRLSCRLPV